MKINYFNSTSKDFHFLSLTSLLIGILILSLQDALIKLISNGTSFWQLQLIRSFFNLYLLIIIVSFLKSFHLLWPVNWKPVFFRGLMMVLCMFCFFSASPILSVSQMAAGLYTFPIFVTILSVLITKEKVGIYRIFALLIGFLGSLFILEPWNENFIVYQLLPILAGFFYACNIILIRRHCRNESPISLTFFVGILFFISGFLGVTLLEFYDINYISDLPFISKGWIDLSIYILLLIIICSFLNTIGNLSLAKAYQNAESSWLAPLDYFYLIFACLWSKVIFDTWPSLINFFGIIMIALSGIIISYREKIKKLV